MSTTNPDPRSSHTVTLTERRPLTVALGWICTAMALVVLGCAFFVIIQRGNHIDRLLDDVGRLQAKVDSIDADRDAQRQVEDCRHLFESDVFVRSGEYALAEGRLVEALANNDDTAVPLIDLATATDALAGAVVALQGYSAAPDPAGECSHPIPS